MLNKKFNLIIFLIFCLSFFLRFYKVTQVPPSPYWEEVALGYDAYSILKTAKDHHGNFMPLVSFESFGDFKPSLYFYSIVPFIKLVGLNILAIRLPSVFSGLVVVLSIALIVYELTRSKKTTILALLVASISPWAIEFSRAGWEVNLATALITLGVLFGLKFINKSKNINLILSSLLLILSMYAYHSARIISPLLGLFIFLFWLFSQKKLKKTLISKSKFIFILLLSLFLLNLPLLRSLNSNTINQRFKETSIFNNQEIILQSNNAKELDNYSLISKIFYHRYLLYGREILKNYVSHFNLDFLFISGDNNPRHSSQYFGIFYYLDFVFLCLGLFYISKKFHKKYLILIFWLLISILPSALTKTTPHALRILPSMPVFIIFIALGLSFLFKLINNFKYKKYILFLMFISYLISFIAFYRNYLTVYPKAHASEWQYGYEELINKINELKNQNPDLPVFISRSQGRPAMYYWFYSQTDPKLVQEQNNKVLKDQGEYLEFQNIKFFTNLEEVGFQKGILAVSSDYFQYLEQKFKLELEFNNNYQIKDPLGNIVWHVLLIK